jgi:phosphatidylinositol alpha-1,6-mannosyltransferase
LVLKSAPAVHYLMAGLPALKEPLTSLARDLGVADRVHFLGRVDQETLVTAYNACDVYIMTSRHSKAGDFEGYGIAVVEAAFCGKPAVVSAGSGLEEAVSAGETGLVVPEDDHRATAAAITRLLSDVPLRRQLGRKARERALREQTWANRMVEYDRVLKAIVTGHRGVDKI